MTATSLKQIYKVYPEVNTHVINMNGIYIIKHAALFRKKYKDIYYLILVRAEYRILEPVIKQAVTPEIMLAEGILEASKHFIRQIHMQDHLGIYVEYQKETKFGWIEDDDQSEEFARLINNDPVLRGMKNGK